MRGPIDLPKSGAAGCISRTIELLACTSGPESMHSPQQISAFLRLDGRSDARNTNPGDSMAGSPPGICLAHQCWIGFADILASLCLKTIHQSSKQLLLQQRDSRGGEKLRYTYWQSLEHGARWFKTVGRPQMQVGWPSRGQFGLGY